MMDGTIDAALAPPAWSLPKRLGFRFLTAYLLLYCPPFLLGFLPGLEMAVNAANAWLWSAIVPRVARGFFGLEIKAETTGSGDTTFDYVTLLTMVLIAVGTALVWTLVEGSRKSHPRLAVWVSTLARFSLAYSMLIYGGMKVLPTQFSQPRLDRLLQPFGDASPMGLVWTFMGASPAYTSFTGIAEFASGLLLTMRRTALLGALLAIGVMSNVVMINLCYDVPVKLYSSHLLLMAVALVLPHAGRLLDIFVRHRPTEPRPLVRLFLAPKWHRGALALRTAVALAVAGGSLWQAHSDRVQYGNLAPRSPLYGVWNVAEFTIDGEIHPPLLTDPLRWRRVVFDRPDGISIHPMEGRRVVYSAKLDPEKKTLELGKYDDEAWKVSFAYRETGEGRMELVGELDGKTLVAQLERREMSTFLLRSRGFHWINEFPFNR